MGGRKGRKKSRRAKRLINRSCPARRRNCVARKYAQDSSWREDNRCVSNGDQVSRVAALAMKRGKSVDFTGYWQRHIAD
jgi:hypothetical protein